MVRTKVSKRDLNFLVIGVLFAFFLQVFYELLNEVMNPNLFINLNWLATQAVLVVIVGLSLLWMILTKLEEK